MHGEDDIRGGAMIAGAMLGAIAAFTNLPTITAGLIMVAVAAILSRTGGPNGNARAGFFLGGCLLGWLGANMVQAAGDRPINIYPGNELS